MVFGYSIFPTGMVASLNAPALGRMFYTGPRYQNPKDSRLWKNLKTKLFTNAITAIEYR